MKKILIFLFSLLFSEDYKKNFNGIYRQALDNLAAKKDTAIPVEKFYYNFIKDKSEPEIRAYRDRWERTGSWPVISFNHQIISIRDVSEAFYKTIDNNKEQFAEITLLTLVDFKSVYIRLYISKDDAIMLEKGLIFKGYGFCYQLLNEVLYLTLKSYPVITEQCYWIQRKAGQY